MSLASRFMELLRGSALAHGTYRPPEPGDHVGKVEIKTSARTVREPVTEALWALHLSGVQPLGVIPIREDDTCSWGCIDVDSYDVVHADLVRRVNDLGIRMWVGKSKSGGAHIFLFLASPAPALHVQRYLREVAARLGLATSEIFPKQSHVIRDKGDMGNWIIMPYFGEAMAIVRPGGGEMTAEEFVDAAERKLVPTSVLTLPVAADVVQDLSDGPPCLQHLCSVGFPEGTRNNGLFALGTYLKMRDPNGWERLLEEHNQKYMHPPLPSEEVAEVKNQLRKKEYRYRCSDVPLVTHCNSNLCRTRRFGVGDDSAPMFITGLSVLDTDPPLWFVDIGEDRIELSTDNLLDHRRFVKVCVEKLLRVYAPMKHVDWARMLAVAMQSVVRIESPPEVSVDGVFFEALGEFLTNRRRGKRREDLLSGRPWEDPEAKRHYFQLSNLRSHIERYPELRSVTRGYLTQRIKELGGDHQGLSIEGRFRNCFWVPSSAFEAAPEVKSPPIEEEPM